MFDRVFNAMTAATSCVSASSDEPDDEVDLMNESYQSNALKSNFYNNNSDSFSNLMSRYCCNENGKQGDDNHHENKDDFKIANVLYQNSEIKSEIANDMSDDKVYDSYKSKEHKPNGSDILIKNGIIDEITNNVQKNNDKSDIDFMSQMDECQNHHARRPMNAFLIFCKRHRPLVREKYPNIENRAITKILGEWWTTLDKDDKEKYREVAKQYKEAFLQAHPDFQWYKLPAPPLRKFAQRPASNTPQNTGKSSPTSESPTTEKPKYKRENGVDRKKMVEKFDVNPVKDAKRFSGFTPGKLADESQLGNLYSLINPDFTNYQPEPEKKIKTIIPVVKNQETHELAWKLKQFDGRGGKQENKINGWTNRMHANVNDVKVKDEKDTFEYSNGLKSITQQDLINLAITRTLDQPSQLPAINFVYNPSITYQRSNSMSSSVSSVSSEEYEAKTEERVERVQDEDYRNDDQSNAQKPHRKCKGKRYAEFITKTGLVKNTYKRKLTKAMMRNAETKAEHTNLVSNIITNTSHVQNQYRVTLTNTIEKLATRTGYQIEVKKECEDECEKMDVAKPAQKNHQVQLEFNLDEKIKELPSMSLDQFHQRKEEIKKKKTLSKRTHRFNRIKRKKPDVTSQTTNQTKPSSVPGDVKKLVHFPNYTGIASYTDPNNNPSFSKLNEAFANERTLVGSRKRKARKTSITHMPKMARSCADQQQRMMHGPSMDLFNNLATLAEVAAERRNACS